MLNAEVGTVGRAQEENLIAHPSSNTYSDNIIGITKFPKLIIRTSLSDVADAYY